MNKGVRKEDVHFAKACHLLPSTAINRVDDFEADRSPSRLYRTAPLRGLFSHEKGGFYHDGRFPTLRAVVDHYDQALATALIEDQKNDLVAYLRTL